VGLGHGQHEGRDQPPGRRTDDADADAARDLVVQRCHVGFEGVELALDAAGPGHDRITLLGQRAARSIDERGAQLALEPSHVGGDVRLDGVQGPGGGGEAAVLGDGEEGVELAEVHRWK
jgi:hypothetical protein